MIQDDDIVDTEKNLLKVVDVEYLGGHRLFVRFDDGKQGNVDLSSLVKEGIFSELQDSNQFAQFGLERGTLVWSNRLDISPEYLYRQIH
jgi:hypothetical protein